MIRFLAIFIIICLISLAYPQDWQWEHNDQLLNPYNIHTRGMNTPFAGDFDDDGDIDLVVGCRGGVLQYYENIGTPDSAIWQMDDDYFSGIELDTMFAPQPSLVDLNGDGLDELYLTFADQGGWPAGIFARYTNGGTQDNPIWNVDTFEIECDNPNYYYHQFLDFDYDGDYDLLLSADLWSGDYKFFYENIGDSSQYAFIINNDVFSNFNEDYIGEYMACFMADVIGDSRNELLLVVGAFDVDATQMILFRNTGANDIPVWEESSFWFGSNYYSNPVFADLDNDSDLDMMMGNRFPPLYYNENLGNPDSLEFVHSYNGTQLGQLYVDRCENICFVDYDHDLDYDFTFFYYWSDYWGTYYGYGSNTNSGTPEVPLFNSLNPFLSFGPIHYASNIYLSAGDLNGDSFPELATNYPRRSYLINNGGNGYDAGNSAVFEIDDTSYSKYYELADLNNDGLNDLIARKADSLTWMIYKNVGSPQNPAWLRMPEWLAGIDISVERFRGAYINGDDKIDLIGIDSGRHLAGFIGVGNGDYVSFQYIPEMFEDWIDYNITYFDCVDIDGDGDDDILENNSGYINVIENRTPVAVPDNNNSLPAIISLLQNYPNPFNSSTNISFSLPKAGYVSLIVYDILGRQVETILEGTLTAGGHTIRWTAHHGIPSGIYFYRLETESSSIARQMVFVK